MLQAPYVSPVHVHVTNSRQIQDWIIDSSLLTQCTGFKTVLLLLGPDFLTQEPERQNSHSWQAADSSAAAAEEDACSLPDLRTQSAGVFHLASVPLPPRWLLTQCLFLCVHLARELNTPFGFSERKVYKLAWNFPRETKEGGAIAHLRANN